MTKELNKEVEVQETPKREMRKLTAMDTRKIIKFLAKTKIKDELFDLFRPQDLSPVYTMDVENWAEYRSSLDLDIKELRDHQSSYKTLEEACYYNGLGTKVVPKPRTREDSNFAMVSLVYSLIEDDERFDLTLDLLADLYNLSREEIESVPLEELVLMVTGVANNSNFFS